LHIIFRSTLSDIEAAGLSNGFDEKNRRLCMTQLAIIKDKIKKLYRTNPNIQINVLMKRPKVCLSNEPAVIKGVYPHIFRIEERSSGFTRCHTVQYADVLTKCIEIVEIAEA
jgi:uncharacterized protein Veg